MPGVLDRPCFYFMQVPVQALKPRLERGLQKSLQRLRFTRQLNSGKRGGVGGIARFVAWAGSLLPAIMSQVEVSLSATSSPNN